MAKDKSYRELSRQLDEILDTLQTSDLDIDEAVTAYENGMRIVTELEAYLKAAENKVIKINKQWDDRAAK